MKIRSFGIVTDCDCTNAAGRQALRVQSLFGLAPQIVGARSDLEAAGHLVDALDAMRVVGDASILLGNVAPRCGFREQWPNGTPFGYLRVGTTLVVTTVSGYTLSLVKKLRLAETVHVLDIPTVMEWAVGRKLITRPEAEHTVKTQFRSYEFLPRAALWIADGWKGIPSTAMRLDDIVPDAPAAVWYIDQPFGNCKTTLLGEERHLTRFAELPFTEHLADVPPGKSSWITGSSGFARSRWLEVVVQGTSAAETFSLKKGDSLR